MSFFIQCKNCSFVFFCSACSVSLTLHSDKKLTCHYCNYTTSVPAACPDCVASEKQFITKGVGTQRIVSILQRLFPATRIGRADLDTTSKKKLWQNTLHDFENGHIDILVGTQTITKGYHFPNVTLVGIIWADLNLHFPFYTASETMIQQVIQVAGRSGRDKKNGLVIVQTMTQDPLFSLLDEQKYLRFYKQEMRSRQEVRYPELKYKDEKILTKEAEAIMHLLYNKSKSRTAISILGPSKPAVHTIKRIHSRSLYLKSPTITDLTTLYKSIDQSLYKSSIFFVPNPYR